MGTGYTRVGVGVSFLPAFTIFLRAHSVRPQKRKQLLQDALILSLVLHRGLVFATHHPSHFWGVDEMHIRGKGRDGTRANCQMPVARITPRCLP